MRYAAMVRCTARLHAYTHCTTHCTRLIHNNLFDSEEISMDERSERHCVRTECWCKRSIERLGPPALFLSRKPVSMRERWPAFLANTSETLRDT